MPQGQKRQRRFCAPGKRSRRGPCEAQRRLGAAGPPSRREHKRGARRSRAGARAYRREDNPISADALAQAAPPSRAMQRANVASIRVERELVHSRGSGRFACWQNRRERPRTGVPRACLGLWGGRNSAGADAPVARLRPREANSALAGERADGRLHLRKRRAAAKSRRVFDAREAGPSALPRKRVDRQVGLAHPWTCKHAGAAPAPACPRQGARPALAPATQEVADATPGMPLSRAPQPRQRGRQRVGQRRVERGGRKGFAETLGSQAGIAELIGPNLRPTGLRASG